MHYLARSAPPGSAGSIALGAGAFLLLKSSQISSMVTNSTPSCFLKYSMSLEKPVRAFLSLFLFWEGGIQNAPVVVVGMADLSSYLPFMHQQDLRVAGDVGVDGDGEDELVVLAVAVVELVAPDVLDVAGVDEAVAVGRRLDEHHRRQVVQVPARGDLHQPGLLPLRQRLHPRLRPLPVVDAVPRVPDPQVVRLAVVVAHAVVVFDAVVQQQLAPFLTAFPPTIEVDPKSINT